MRVLVKKLGKTLEVLQIKASILRANLKKDTETETQTRKK